ncbi:MAG: hypothetical protein ACLT33_04400 [Lachnospira pectinoschiza]
MNSYLENYSTGVDKDGNATGDPILVVQDVNTIRMRNTSDKNNGTGLNVYAITFTDCVVKYLTQNGTILILHLMEQLGFLIYMLISWTKTLLVQHSLVIMR